MTPRTLEDLDNAKRDLPSMERGRTPLAKEKAQGNMVQSHQDKVTRRRSMVSAGILGKQVISRMIAGQGQSSNRVKANRVLLERATM